MTKVAINSALSMAEFPWSAKVPIAWMQQILPLCGGRRTGPYIGLAAFAGIIASAVASVAFHFQFADFHWQVVCSLCISAAFVVIDVIMDARVALAANRYPALANDIFSFLNATKLLGKLFFPTAWLYGVIGGAGLAGVVALSFVAVLAMVLLGWLQDEDTLPSLVPCLSHSPNAAVSRGNTQQFPTSQRLDFSASFRLRPLSAHAVTPRGRINGATASVAQMQVPVLQRRVSAPGRQQHHLTPTPAADDSITITSSTSTSFKELVKLGMGLTAVLCFLMLQQSKLSGQNKNIRLSMWSWAATILTVPAIYVQLKKAISAEAAKVVLYYVVFDVLRIQIDGFDQPWYLDSQFCEGVGLSEVQMSLTFNVVCNVAIGLPLYNYFFSRLSFRSIAVVASASDAANSLVKFALFWRVNRHLGVSDAVWYLATNDVIRSTISLPCHSVARAVLLAKFAPKGHNVAIYYAAIWVIQSQQQSPLSPE